MSKVLTKVEPVSVLPAMPSANYYGTLDEIERVAHACAKSGFWREIKDVSQAVVKMLAGREMGIAPLDEIERLRAVEAAVRREIAERCVEILSGLTTQIRREFGLWA